MGKFICRLFAVPTSYGKRAGLEVFSVQYAADASIVRQHATRQVRRVI
jgi:hypothetical protein